MIYRYCGSSYDFCRTDQCQANYGTCSDARPSGFVSAAKKPEVAAASCPAAGAAITSITTTTTSQDILTVLRTLTSISTLFASQEAGSAPPTITVSAPASTVTSTLTTATGEKVSRDKVRCQKSSRAPSVILYLDNITKPATDTDKFASNHHDHFHSTSSHDNNQYRPNNNCQSDDNHHSRTSQRGRKRCDHNRHHHSDSRILVPHHAARWQRRVSHHMPPVRILSTNGIPASKKTPSHPGSPSQQEPSQTPK